MKKVDIVYDSYHRFPTVKVDDTAISQYSDLGLIESNDIHEIANKIKKLIPAEIEDRYSLTVWGPAFVGLMLKELLSEDDACMGVLCNRTYNLKDLEKEGAFISSVMKKYGCADNTIPKIRVSGPGAGTLSYPYLVVAEDAPDWYIKMDSDDSESEWPTIIRNAEKLLIGYKQDVLVVSLPTGYERDYFDYLYERTILMPFILTGRAKCAQLKMSKEEELTLQAYKEGKTVYLFEVEKDTIDVGSSCTCTFSVFPPEKSDFFKMEILPAGAASYKNGRLSVYSGDTITINIIDSNGTVQETHPIRVVHHNYVSGVKVFPENIEVETGEKCTFEYFPIPADAEDAKALRISVSDSSIASIVDDRYVVGLSAGYTGLKIEGQNYKGNIPINVIPKLSGITLDEKVTEVELGKDKVFHCEVQPREARFEKPVWKLDNVKLGKINVSEDGLSCQFKATTESFEKGCLVCELPNTEYSDSCEIKIVPIEQPMILMALAWIFTGIGCLIGLFVFPMAAAEGTAISGYFMDFFMPVGLVLAIIGRRINNKNSNGIFTGAILTNLLYALFMILVGAAMCG